MTSRQIRNKSRVHWIESRWYHCWRQFDHIWHKSNLKRVHSQLRDDKSIAQMEANMKSFSPGLPAGFGQQEQGWKKEDIIKLVSRCKTVCIVFVWLLQRIFGEHSPSQASHLPFNQPGDRAPDHTHLGSPGINPWVKSSPRVDTERVTLLRSWPTQNWYKSENHN